MISYFKWVIVISIFILLIVLPAKEIACRYGIVGEKADELIRIDANLYCNSLSMVDVTMTPVGSDIAVLVELKPSETVTGVHDCREIDFNFGKYQPVYHHPGHIVIMSNTEQEIKTFTTKDEEGTYHYKMENTNPPSVNSNVPSVFTFKLLNVANHTGLSTHNVKGQFRIRGWAELPLV